MPTDECIVMGLPIVTPQLGPSRTKRGDAMPHDLRSPVEGLRDVD